MQEAHQRLCPQMSTAASPSFSSWGTRFTATTLRSLCESSKKSTVTRMMMQTSTIPVTACLDERLGLALGEGGGNDVAACDHIQTYANTNTYTYFTCARIRACEVKGVCAHVHVYQACKCPYYAIDTGAHCSCSLAVVILGGSWVVISGVISRVTIDITHIRGFITLMLTTHEPPSIGTKVLILEASTGDPCKPLPRISVTRSISLVPYGRLSELGSPFRPPI